MIVSLLACASPAPRACNGDPALCDRRVDEVAFAGAHNAMSNADDGWIAPNQTHGPAQALEDGVRALVFDTHPLDDGTPGLCHGYCSLGSRPLADGLADVTAFLDAHPTEVVALIFESYVDEAATEGAFVEADLLRHTYAGDTAPWPTLGALVDADQRLLVFTDDASASLPWHRYSYDALWENPYHAESREDLLAQCGPDRGDPALPLWTLNHFLTAPLASPELAAEANASPFFADRVRACRDETGDLPNFVLVDFYDVGTLFDVVATLNAGG